MTYIIRFRPCPCSEKRIQNAVTWHLTFKHLMGSSSLPWVCGRPTVVMRRFLLRALLRKVTDAAEPQAPLTCSPQPRSPWADTGEVRQQKVERQEGSRPTTWRGLTCTPAILEHRIAWTRSIPRPPRARLTAQEECLLLPRLSYSLV